MSEQISDEQKQAVDTTLLKVAAWIEGRKMQKLHSALVPDATDGFNLACDFLAHELRKMRELTEWNKEKGYSAAYNFHKPSEGGE